METQGAFDGSDQLNLSPLAELHSTRWRRRSSLVRHALNAFRQREWYQALQFIDPCCQDPIPAAEDLLLRSEILSRLGEPQLSARDLDAAYAIDPTSPSIQARILARLWQTDEDGKALIALAERLIRSHAASSILRFCLSRVLSSQASLGAAFPSASRAGLNILVLTERPAEIVLRAHFRTNRRDAVLVTGVNHPEADILGCAATVQMGWSTDAQLVALSALDAPLLWSKQVLPRPRFEPAAPTAAAVDRPKRANGLSSDPVNVIVPVYDGLAATRRCLQSLLSDTATRTPHRIVLVDDRGPDPRLSDLLGDVAKRGQGIGRDVVLIRNPANFGFIGSVNAALAAYPDGAAVLLNADTIVPPGWLDRLVRAGASPDVGTVTPFSNNGELTSVPRMFEAAPIPSVAEVAAIDRIAAQVNAGRTVDLPNGIGFCLYLTEAARRVCPFINDVDYDEGYLEEVDLCLRIAENGLRNVCACDVFVGHEGGLSFKDTKRALVVRNLGALERRFPTIRRDTFYFRAEDPLAEPRRALEVGMLERGAIRQSVDLVIGDPARANWFDEDIAAGTEEMRPAIHLVPVEPADGRSAFRMEGEMLIAPSVYRVAGREGEEPVAQIARLLAGFDVRSVIFRDLRAPIEPLARLPAAVGRPYDVRLAHDGFAAKDWSRALVEGARRVTTASPHLLRQARLVGRDDVLLQDAANHHGIHLEGETSRGDGSTRTTIAVLVGRSTARTQRLLLALARRAQARRAPLRFVTFGDDPGSSAVATGLIVHAGPPISGEAEGMLRIHDCRATLSLIETDLFEHPAQAWLRLAPKPLVTLSQTLVEPLRLDREASVPVLPTIEPEPLLDILCRLVQDTTRMPPVLVTRAGPP